MAATIPIPNGFEMPEGVKPGQSFKLLATFRMKGDRLEVLDIEGQELDSDDGMTFSEKVRKNLNEPKEQDGAK